MTNKEKCELYTMKELFKEEYLIEMANLSPKKTGLNVVIWSEQQGFKRNKSDKLPRFKIQGKDYEVSYTLEQNPKLLAQSGKIKQSDKNDIKQALNYVVKNIDLFLKHYNSTPYEFNDDDLKDALKERGYYK